MNEPTELDHAMADIVNAFLRWPLPKTVCVDRVAMMPGEKHRSGTNLLTCPETVGMVQEVVRPIIERYFTAAHAKALEDGRRMRELLHKIAYEPIGQIDATYKTVHDDIVDMARAALAATAPATGGKGGAV